jgi:hypothetical protein
VPRDGASRSWRDDARERDAQLRDVTSVPRSASSSHARRASARKKVRARTPAFAHGYGDVKKIPCKAGGRAL